jgi:hypothetical protein
MGKHKTPRPKLLGVRLPPDRQHEITAWLEASDRTVNGLLIELLIKHIEENPIAITKD